VDFEFLPDLPNSDLDDRTLEDLLEECRLRIPRYCPEWTNFNPSDPGMTLLELFAWMTEQMLLRFNQVPRRNYVAFLEMLGVRLQPPSPAQVELTFYLNTALPEPHRIRAGVEVATSRSEEQSAVVFSTASDLVVGLPRIGHFLTAPTAETQPQQLRDPFSNRWTQEDDGTWQGPQQEVFEPLPQPGNCFYLVLEPETMRSQNRLQGNVLALTVRGEAATGTGINPNAPPRRWEAWDGQTWQPVLRQEMDDGTQGFSFSQMTQQGLDPLQGADVLLHLPQQWPVAGFANYQGHWLRCTCQPPELGQFGQSVYLRSPRIAGLAVRSIGGTVAASQSLQVQDEVLGVSDGTPNQTFELFAKPVLPRLPEDCLQVEPPGGLVETWQEVSDFAESTPEDRHYVLDSITGKVKFGPVIREPGQVLQQTQMRSQWQRQGYLATDAATADLIGERQYGAIPPRGSVIRMVSYRTGGGQRGNVQAGAIAILKSAVPYVAAVTNHAAARYGADAETLDQAVIRVPKLLRSRDRAVTPEDFEILTLQAGGGAIAQVRCLPPQASDEAGTVRLMLVPQADLSAIDRGEGIAPDRFAITPALAQQVMDYLDERKLLGVRVQLEEPEYVGVAVQTQVGLAPAYRSAAAQALIVQTIEVSLYRFLNPITGGPDGKGWPFGRPLYASDIIALIQQVPGVRYLGAVQLFRMRQQGNRWLRSPTPEDMIVPGPYGLICSWNGSGIRLGHTVRPFNTPL
jgi:predicted phage baseplate assembly protein